MYKYKVSTIIPIYNVEKYLSEAIDSIINQSIGIENIQIILVNDGSKQNEEQICLKYQKRYPNNIKYIYQKNSGVSTARNNGIENAEGEYIAFLDPDDKIEKHVYRDSIEMLEKHKEICFVTFRQRLFEASHGYHAIDFKFDEGSRVVDIFKDHDCIQLSACASVIRREAIGDLRFDKNIMLSEDAKFMTEILFNDKNHKYGMITSADYLYRKRREKTSAIQTSIDNIDWYTITSKAVYNYVFELSKKMFGKVIPYAQYFVMYHLQNKINITVSSEIDDKEIEKHDELIYKLLQNIDDEIFFEQKKFKISNKIQTLNIKYQALLQKYIKVKDNELYYKNKFLGLVEDDNVKLLSIDSDDKNLVLNFAGNEYIFNNNLKIMVNGKETKYESKEKLYNDYRHFKDFAPKERIFSIKLPNNRKSVITFTINGNKLMVGSRGCLLALKENKGIIKYKGRNIRINSNKDTLIVSKNSPKVMLLKLLYNFRVFFKRKKVWLVTKLASLLSFKYKNTVIVYYDKGRKSAFDKYVDKSNAIYVDKDKIPNSVKHKIMNLNAKEIYQELDEDIVNIFGKAYKYYYNNDKSTKYVLVNKNTDKSLIQRTEYNYKNVKIIK